MGEASSDLQRCQRQEAGKQGRDERSGSESKRAEKDHSWGSETLDPTTEVDGGQDRKHETGAEHDSDQCWGCTQCLAVESNKRQRHRLGYGDARTDRAQPGELTQLSSPRQGSDQTAARGDRQLSFHARSVQQVQDGEEVHDRADMVRQDPHLLAYMQSLCPGIIDHAVLLR